MSPFPSHSINIYIYNQYGERGNEESGTSKRESGFDFRIDAQRDQINLVVTGSGELLSLSEYGTNLHSRIDPATRITLRVAPSQFYRIQSRFQSSFLLLCKIEIVVSVIEKVSVLSTYF